MESKNIKPEHRFQMFSYFDEFYKASFYHFIVSAVCAALSALGMEFSRGSDGNTIAYYIPAMVLAGIHFLLTVIALVLFCVTRRYSLNARASGSVEAHRDYSVTKFLYYFMNICSMLWSIIGAAITGSTVGCTGGYRSKCHYTVNIGINRAIAIIIIVIHVLNLIPTYFIITTFRKPTRQGAPSLLPKTTTRTPKNLKQSKSINKDKKLGREENMNENKRNQGNIPSQRIKMMSQKTNRSRSLEMNSLSRLVHRNDRYYDDSLIARRVPQCPTVPNDIPPNDVKPLPKRNKKLLLPAVSKVIVQLNSRRIKPRDETSGGTPAFVLAESSSCSSNEEGLQIEVKRKPDVSPPRLPPPSYNDVISSEAGTNPYWLPPLSDEYSEAHRLPENMYVGDSYPDTELVAIQPSKYT
ncbi:uncharacterized protein LOC123550102 [Mercenaria mercenaria]|uniref:uncharacterized protein LOC123550102 n=1 Tax=Mercenaria mercenaria TaxID=6596 RepID=UPI00234EF9E0|nr:uncharacterized protein LOC123550102 [Mercenaria mercenaria]